MSRLHVNRPKAFLYRTVRGCPTCGQPRRMLVTMYVWHDIDVDCLTCGERWAAGEMRPRPFQRGWRKVNVSRALVRAEAATSKRAATAALHRAIRTGVM